LYEPLNVSDAPCLVSLCPVFGVCRHQNESVCKLGHKSLRRDGVVLLAAKREELVGMTRQFTRTIL
jgi:hypothetical protein